MGSDYNLFYEKQGSTTITAKVEDTEEYAYVENEVTCRVTVNKACVTAGTLVTLADGTQAPIETLKPGDMVMTWSFWNGRYAASFSWQDVMWSVRKLCSECDLHVKKASIRCELNNIKREQQTESDCPRHKKHYSQER